VDEYIDFIRGSKEQKTFMTSSGPLGQIAVPVMHYKSQVTTIYIFCENKPWHEKWAKEMAQSARCLHRYYTDL
jgi:hypothetical protein